ncbi:hypothetical protein HK101_004095 [Irineochytrium annulatum]|nr:hypothetical protein HK101_004095 [Irineochytrium annulatum]
MDQIDRAPAELPPPPRPFDHSPDSDQFIFYQERLGNSQTTLLSRTSETGRQPPLHPAFSFFRRLVTVKPFTPDQLDSGVGSADRPASQNPSGYKRSLNAFDLTLIGVGCIIGAGIFVMVGKPATENAGPALVISILIAAFVSGLACLCYGEMASLVPISGSAYTYVYATLGELAAWIIGWDLLLEYVVGAAAVASSWSGYFASFLGSASNGMYEVDPRWSRSPIRWKEGATFAEQGFEWNYVDCPVAGGLAGETSPCVPYADMPAIAISILLTSVLCMGVRVSSTVNGFFVFVKIAILLLFIGFGIQYINLDNYSPFIPPNTTGNWGDFGWSGILTASTIVFFSFIGFDAVATTAQECKRPQRDLPIGIVASLSICTALYIGVTVVLTGIQNYTQIDVQSPLASAIPVGWLRIVIEAGALTGLSSVLLVLLLSQPRILQAMAHDGLLPRVFSRVDSITGVPQWGTVTSGLFCSILAGLLPVDVLANMTNVGTLFAYAAVCVAIPVLRCTRPDAPRRFKVPGGLVLGGFIIPILGASCSIALIGKSIGPISSIVRLAIWMAVGLVVYMSFGFYKSKLRNATVAETTVAFQKVVSDKEVSAKSEAFA